MLGRRRESVRVGYLPEVWLAPVDVRERRSVVRYRESLSQQRIAPKFRIKALLREQRVPLDGEWGNKSLWTKEGMSWLASPSLRDESSWILQELLTRLQQCIEAIALADKQIQHSEYVVKLGDGRQIRKNYVVTFCRYRVEA